MSIDKLQGLRCAVATVDEWLSGVIKEDVIGTIEQSASKNKDYIIVCVSSEGTVRNGPGDTIKMELNKILKGEYLNPHVSIFYYKQDDVKEIGNPDLWIKSNPNIGITVSYDTIQQDVEKAEQVPSSRNDILAKVFNIACEGFTYFFTYEQTIPGPYQDYTGMQCSVGADLSQGNDFCAFSLLFPLSTGDFGLKARSFISSYTYDHLAPAMRIKYDDFIKEGTLIVLEGTILDIDEVFDDLVNWINANDYVPEALGYDPYNAKEFVDRWAIEFGDRNIEKVIQGAKTESVPLGEIQKLVTNKQWHFHEQMVSWCMGNAMVLKDTNNNMKLYKQKYEYKIDTVSAAMDAYVAFKIHKQEF
jgi:phage terminase large subunit-like protein